MRLIYTTSFGGIMSAYSTKSIEELQNILKEAASKKNSKHEPVDWESRKRWWLGKIEELYGNIEKWCQPLSIHLDKFDITVQEQFIGNYITQKLAFNIGNTAFLFVPIGRNIIGGRGRVDILYRDSRSKLILLAKGEFSKNKNTNSSEALNDPEPEDTEWYFVGSSYRDLNLLTEQSFLAFLSEKAGA